tara:strand:- start:269 stop:2713 length:2445 start_codon:yes stop_codon:yes gene_type:complete
MSQKFTFIDFTMKVNDKILDKYMGFNIRKINNYFEILRLNALKHFQVSKLENLYLDIDQKSILNLELQRELKSKNGGVLPNENKIMVPAKIRYNDENYKIKIRTKGTRLIHWENKNETSYKIDIRGEKKLFGMEEFSIQKPITKNYTYEYLFHKLLGHVGLANIKYFFVNLYLNNENLGVYAVEESFSKELIERQSRRNGPIFSTKDELGKLFPNIAFDLYSRDYWIEEKPQLISNLFSILNNIKDKNFNINSYYDIDKWAKYFAIIDLTGTYHGSILKSVKLYYNPVTALFEPIGYDLHKGAGIFDNFIIMDFLQEKTPASRIACSWICPHEEWFFKFLINASGELNYEFISKYIKYLEKYSDEEFVVNFLEENNKELFSYNNEIYKDYSKSDRVNWKGAGFFVYDEDYLFNRAKLIKSRINKIDLQNIEVSKSDNLLYFEDHHTSSFPIKAKTTECENKRDIKDFFFAGSMSISLNTTCNKIILKDYKGNIVIKDLKNYYKVNKDKKKAAFKNLNESKHITKVSDNEYIIISDITIKENTLVDKNQKFILKKNISINIINGSSLFIEGNFIFLNDDENYTTISSTDSSGSLVFNNNNFDLKNIIFANLSKPNLEDYILYGGVNFINSNLKLENIIIKNSKNEDGINIINSKSKLSNIFFNNISADALDVDFGEINFKNIHCEDIGNDCLDVSGATIYGENLTSINVSDKGLSVGEKSNIKIKNMNFFSNYIALAVKDGSSAFLDNIKLKENVYDIALFNKKNEFGKPTLIINKLESINEKKIIQSIGTNLLINGDNFFGTMSDLDINLNIYR